MTQHKLNIYINCSVICTYILLSFSESKMTLAELKSLVEKVQNLPCVMNQLEEVQVRSYVSLSKQTCIFLSDLSLPKFIKCTLCVYIF